MNKKLKIVLYVVYILIALIAIRLLVFPVYTRCSGNNCRVIHLNRITGYSYYTNVEHKHINNSFWGDDKQPVLTNTKNYDQQPSSFWGDDAQPVLTIQKYNTNNQVDNNTKTYGDEDLFARFGYVDKRSDTPKQPVVQNNVQPDLNIDKSHK